MIRIFIMVVVCGVLFSCRATKKIQTAIAKKDTTYNVTPSVIGLHDDSMAFIKENYNHLLNKKINFTTFSAKIDVDYEDADGKKNNVNAHVRMYKDSIIWIVITGALGFEGLRVFITNDSVKLIDKPNKIYTARSVSFLQEVSALPLDLKSLQDLLVGNPIFIDSNFISYSKSPNAISLLSVSEYFKSLYTISETDKLLQSCKLDDLDQMKSRTCYLTYGGYDNRNIYKANFSTERTIIVTEKKKLDIKLDFKQYNFNETLSFPFSIQKNYKRN